MFQLRSCKSGVLPIAITFKLYKGHDRVNMLQNPYSITIEVTVSGGVITGGTTIGFRRFRRRREPVLRADLCRLPGKQRGAEGADEAGQPGCGDRRESGNFR